MAPIIHRDKKRRAQRQLVSAKGMFYPGEVVRILGLEGMDYQQLRELWRLISPAKNMPTRKWARYTFKDLVILRNAIELAGGREALKLGRRLRVKQLSRVLQALQSQFGAQDPLTEIRLERAGSLILAHMSGGKFDPVKSQYVFPEIMRGVDRYLKTPPLRGPKKTLKEIKEQKAQVKLRGFSIKQSVRLPL
jgi:hypothetical protein